MVIEYAFFVKLPMNNSWFDLLWLFMKYRVGMTNISGMRYSIGI